MSEQNILVEIINNAQAISAGVKPALYYGDNAYVHIRFAPNGTPTDAQMTTTPNDFIGFSSNHDEAAPTTANSYIWVRINSAAVQAAVEASMRAAETAATESANSATAANTAKNHAQSAKTAAEAARDTATIKASDASASETAANAARTAAETAKTAAESARTTATTKATEASVSATAANTAKADAQVAKTAAESARDTATIKATEAGASATAASTAKTAAETAKAAAEGARTTATTKATEAAASATAANTAKTAAESAKNIAVTKANEAAASAEEAAGYAEAAGSAHPPVTIQPDTTSTAKPTAGGTVTMVDSVTRNGLGHVEKVNLKTVTLPAAMDVSGKLDVTGDGKDVTVSFDDQASAQVSEIASGGKLALLIGKIKKLLADLMAHTTNKSNPHAVTAAQAGARPSTWMPTAAEVGARPSTWTPTATNVGADPSGTATATVNTHNTNASAHTSLFGGKANASDLTAHTGNTANPHGVTAAQAGAVPTTRTVNGKALSANITLAAADVGARPNTWMPTASNVGAATTTCYTATIPATGWAGSAAPYSVTISVSGMLASDTPLIDIVQTGTESTDAIMRENWTKITRITTAANSIRVFASEVPTAAIPIQLKVVR